MVRYNGLVWSNVAVLKLLPSYIDDPWPGPTDFDSAFNAHNFVEIII